MAEGTAETVADGGGEVGEHGAEGGRERGEMSEHGGQQQGEGAGEHEGARQGEHSGEGGGERAGESHGEEGEAGEESGEYLDRTATWDSVRRGIRLVLGYNEADDSFVGTVANTTDARICRVRVEVHLAGGPELGPTMGRDLGPGESADVVLAADGNDFQEWTAHPEVSPC